MHVTLINPPALVGRFNYSAFTHPPMGPAYLAACLRQKGHTVSIIDAVGEAISEFAPYPPSNRFLVQGLRFDDIIHRIPPENALTGISCMFSHTWPLVRGLIRQIKSAFPDVPVIAGGEHPTALYAYCLRQAPLEACVLGEAENTIVEIADALENGCPLSEIEGIAWINKETREVVRTGERKVITDLDTLPSPAWDLIPWKEYRLFDGPVLSQPFAILASRGCPHNCAFCSAPNMWQRVWRKRTPENIIQEMMDYISAHRIAEFQFRDISPLIQQEWIQDLCMTIREQLPGIRWQMPVGGRPEVIDETTAGLLVSSGCRHIQFAPESGSPAVLAAMNKHLDLNRFKQAVVVAKNAGMRISVLFIIGFPGETRRDIMLTYRLIRWLARHDVEEIAVSSFVLLPGTQIFNRITASRTLKIDDAFFYQAAGATAFTPSASWNPDMGKFSLLIYKWLGLIQFYAIAFFRHPSRLTRILSNLRRGRQETKIDRVMAEIVTKIKRRAF